MTLVGSHGRWDDHDITFMVMVTIKERLKNVECTNKGNELYDVPICCMKFLKYGFFRHWVEGIFYVELEKNLIKWRSKVHLMLKIIVSHSPLVATPNWCGEKCVAKAFRNWRHKVQIMSWYNVFSTTMGQTPPKDLVKVKRWVRWMLAQDPPTHLLTLSALMECDVVWYQNKVETIVWIRM
jgi:hypothetical protein